VEPISGMPGILFRFGEAGRDAAGFGDDVDAILMALRVS